MTEDLDLSDKLQKAPDLIKDIFQKQSLGVRDDSKLTKEQNTKAFKLWVIQFFFWWPFQKTFRIFKGKARMIVEFLILRY